MTRVLPGMFPPTISTTPNSPIVWAKVRTAAVRKPRSESGAATVRKASSGDARSAAAASRGPRPSDSKAAWSGCTMNGRE